MDAARCLARLQKLCSKAEYCRADVYRKALKDLEGDAEAAAKVVEQLVADKYVDEARYASAFAREKAALQGWGPVKIRFQLRGKGIKDADIAAALAEVEPEKAEAKLQKLLEAKARTLKGDPQGRLKLIKYALSRGYDYDVVEKMV
ncbi:MAG: RecX family transcriptional regulator [Bacteroidales bacterium]|nr:RecX family transcriptional regulator [Bacteroidales bacterium]